MSTSAVHRYCSGDAVPPEFATVERFARLCEASPQELVEAHRRWVLADAGRGPRPSSSTASAAPGAQEPAGSAPEFGASSEPGPPSRRRRTPVVRVALSVTVAAVTAVGSVALALHDNGDRDQQTQRHIAGPSVPPTRGTPSTSPSDRPGQGSDKNRAHGKNRPDDSDGSDDRDRSDTEAEGSSGDTSPQPSRNGKGGQAPDAPRGGHKGSAPSGAPAQAPGTPPAARVRPYVYDGCQHSFLVNREPGAMPEPPADQDVPAWVAELGAVSARRQHIEVTLQGAGKGDIVLHAMHVRVRSSGAPPAWNNFRIRTRCEEKVYAKSFDVDLDEAAPRPTPMMGQRDFPYRVSERDPQVLLITAGTKLHNVEWYLEMEWSSGKRHGVLRIDDQGRPFRTSGMEGRPTYTWLGSDGWGTERLPLG